MLTALSSRHKKPITSRLHRTAPLALLPSSLGAALSLLFAFSVTPAVAGAGNGYQPYKDATAGFALAKPDGWNVRNEGLNIWVESPDKSELVLMRAFKPEAGQTTIQYLKALGENFDTMFPQAALDHAQHVQTNGDEIIADMHYQGPKGPAKARLLCRIVDGKGWLYVFAAPEGRYRAEQPKMLHVAQSVAFFAPRNAGSGGNGGSGSGDTMTAAQMKAVEKSLHFTKWLEPTEHAYTLSIPQGWKVESTMHRSGGPTPNFFYAITSPQEDIGIVWGTPDLLFFTEPSQMTMQMGMPEGKNGLMHYMKVPEFNEFFLRKILGGAWNDLTIESSQEDEKAAQKIAAQMQNQYTDNEASAGFTTFKATEVKTGKKIEGIVISSTIRTKLKISGPGGPLLSWYANPQMITTKAGDAQAEARQKKAIVAFFHTGSSLLETPEWMAQNNEAVRQDIAGKSAANIANAQQNSARIAANSAATSDRLMSNFHNHEAAMDNIQHGFINYIGNRTDVTNGAGQTYNVGSGSSHYYQGTNGTIVGTNSAYSPGVDFTPMKEQ